MLTKIIKNYELEDIKTLLAQVENTHHSIFLSSHWLIPWLKVCSTKPILMVVEQNEQVIGLAFWGCKSHWLGNTYYLNQTGTHTDDQMWIEQNDVICMPKHRSLVVTAMLEKFSELNNVAKLIIQTAMSEQWQHDAYLNAEVIHEANYFVDLKKSDDYLSSLSKNTRASIRRSNKLIEARFGEIKVRESATYEYSAILQEIQKLHITKWGQSTFGSGFVNPKFVKFHHELLGITSTEASSANATSSNTKLLTVSAGDVNLGYLYVLISQKHVLFYLSAIEYADLGNKYKPGLSMHYHAIEHFKKLTYDTYDFLAGPARYKEQMSTDSYPVFHITMRTNTTKNKLIVRLKKLLRRN